MSISARNEIVIVGFPRCGTTALIQHFRGDPETETLLTPEGQTEVAWPRIRDLQRSDDRSNILVHKFTAYIYKTDALKYLRDANPASLLTVCVRHPARVLVSWHNIHRGIARSNKRPDHFARKQREFYSNCTLTEYYHKFAKSRLQYDQHLLALLEVVPKNRVIVASQERMALGINAVADHLKALALGEMPSEGTKIAGSQAHKSFAESTAHDIDSEIKEELDQVNSRVRQLVADLRLQSLI